MVLDYNKSYSSEEDQKILFDLRQSWANSVDRYTRLMSNYKLMYNLKGWYDTLIFLAPTIFSRVKKDKNETMIRFKAIKKMVNEITNKYKNTYLGKDKDPEGMEKIIDVLSELEYFIGSTIEKNNMYGTGSYESVI